MDDQQPTHNADAEIAAAQAALKAAQEHLAQVKARHAQQAGDDTSYVVDASQNSAPQQPTDVYQTQTPPPHQQPDAHQANPASYESPTAQPYAAYQQPGAQQQAYQSSQPYTQSTYQQVYAQPVVGAKDHVAAALLAIFLGPLGIHKFYLGNNTAGFIMLGVSVVGGIITLSVATWVMWIVAFIEGIIYLTKTQSEFEHSYVMNQREWF